MVAVHAPAVSVKASNGASAADRWRRRFFANVINLSTGGYQPSTVTLNESIEADTELVDEFCAEGEKDYERLQRSRGK
jgi:hypothetical protein